MVAVFLAKSIKIMTVAKVGILVLQLLHFPQVARSQGRFVCYIAIAIAKACYISDHVPDLAILCLFDIGISLTEPRVSTPGETADFVCLPLGGSITNLQWLVNETLVETLQLNATRTFEFGIGKLTFNNILLNYNGTRITCDAIVNSDVHVTQHSMLYVQGKYIIAPTCM